MCNTRTVGAMRRIAMILLRRCTTWPQHTRPTHCLRLRVPVLFLVLATTALPIELRALGEVSLSFSFNDVPDIVANVIGYLPVGLVLAEHGLLRAVCLAGLLSAGAELSQLVLLHRDPSLTDILSNGAGATLGLLASRSWRMRSPTLRLSPCRAVLAVLLAGGLVLYVWATSGDPVSARGATLPGTLEAAWKLDESSGLAALDASGHHLGGTFRRAPQRLADVMGKAAVFDGTNYLNVGHATAFRLAGSMTISAWINSSAYPVDDAAIVSQLYERRGYQLDTTIDQGPRTLGFKLTDPYGNLMARYGATPLALNTWYYVAGVYNAAEQTLDVYVNGTLDNGVLLGSVSSVQRSARRALYVGRRGNSSQCNFLGALQHVRLYSFALTPSQIAADRRGEVPQAPALQPITSRPPEAPVSDPEDKDMPGVAALVGALVAFACLGLWPSAWRLLVLGSSGAAGGVLLTVTAANLPAFTIWMLPLMALAGGAAVAVSVGQQPRLEAAIHREQHTGVRQPPPHL